MSTPSATKQYVIEEGLTPGNFLPVTITEGLSAGYTLPVSAHSKGNFVTFHSALPSANWTGKGYGGVTPNFPLILAAGNLTDITKTATRIANLLGYDLDDLTYAQNVQVGDVNGTTNAFSSVRFTGDKWTGYGLTSSSPIQVPYILNSIFLAPQTTFDEVGSFVNNARVGTVGSDTVMITFKRKGNRYFDFHISPSGGSVADNRPVLQSGTTIADPTVAQLCGLLGITASSITFSHVGGTPTGYYFNGGLGLWDTFAAGFLDYLDEIFV